MRAALAALGIEPADLATVVVTHIHLDHAGGVGDIASMFPSAEVVVHEKGARHLADPSRLMASARMVYGDALDVLFGELAPVPAARLRTLDDVGAVDLGDGRRLESYYSPGHAKHHVGLLDSLSGDLYVGDAAGVYIPETGDLRPATPPPDFDLEVALASIGEVRLARPVAAAVQPLRAGVGRGRDAGAVGGGDLRLGVGDAGGAVAPGWTWTTRSRRSGSGRCLGTRRSPTTPIRPSPRSSSRSAGRRRTSAGSGTGWTSSTSLRGDAVARGSVGQRPAGVVRRQRPALCRLGALTYVSGD